MSTADWVAASSGLPDEGETVLLHIPGFLLPRPQRRNRLAARQGTNVIRPTWERVLLAAALLLLVLLLIGAIREQTTRPPCYWQSTLVLNKVVDTLVCP